MISENKVRHLVEAGKNDWTEHVVGDAAIAVRPISLFVSAEHAAALGWGSELAPACAAIDYVDGDGARKTLVHGLNLSEVAGVFRSAGVLSDRTGEVTARSFLVLLGCCGGKPVEVEATLSYDGPDPVPVPVPVEEAPLLETFVPETEPPPALTEESTSTVSDESHDPLPDTAPAYVDVGITIQPEATEVVGDPTPSASSGRARNRRPDRR